ncbi:multidrug effflux MFS transporter [uncultured Ruegeria sp.]|uniref:multidrug effflux MFS transporter n=1 Tax=uncultured Ruegeria sp. TaxID=259304 RepID=UPI00262DCC11|nr:multidrug effflux MFS transporter [uncultured Ruegeria sp.]
MKPSAYAGGETCALPEPEQQLGLKPGFYVLGAILGLLSAISPFAIDMYLPSMPQMARDLTVSETAFQVTLVAYFASFGITQLIYGPWADSIGRRVPMLVGLAIFVAASFGAATADTLTELAVWRFIQGAGGSAAMVVPRAIVRDRYTGIEATRLVAIVMLVISTSPMLAPLVGSFVTDFFGWRGIFFSLGIAGAVGAFLLLMCLPETLEEKNKTPARVGDIWRSVRRLLKDPIYMSLVLLSGFGIGSFFVFIASAAFVYTGQFGLTPKQFSIAFAVNAIGFFSASQMAAGLAQRWSMQKVCFIGAAGFALFAALLFVLMQIGFQSLAVLTVCLFLGNAFLGLAIPTSGVLALEDNGDIAGTASSLMGTLQMMCGVVTIAVSAPFFDGTVVPLTASIAVCGVLAFLFSLRLR